MKSIATAVVFFATFAVALPAIAQTRSQEARDSTGMANSQKQLGGLKKDRKIDRMIAHHEVNIHGRHHHHHHA